MYTNDIMLEQVSISEYNELKERWGFPKEPRQGDTLARVLNPIAHDNYEELFGFLLDHPHTYTLSVRRDSGWVRANKADGTRSNYLKELARIAATNRAKRNYLTMSYKTDLKKKDFAEIEFIERNGLIIGYRVSIPHLSGMHDLFDYRGLIPKAFGFTQGLSNNQSQTYLRPNLLQT